MSKLDLNIDKDIINIFEARYQSIIVFEDSINRLHDELNHFKEKIDEQKEKNEFFDESQALHLLEIGKKYLEYCQENLGHPHVPYLLAAVDYLVKEDDAQCDFSTVDGLDDDQALLEAVAAELNISPLVAFIDSKKGA